MLAKKEAVVRSSRMRPTDRELLRETFKIRMARVRDISGQPQKMMMKRVK